MNNKKRKILKKVSNPGGVPNNIEDIMPKDEKLIIGRVKI